MPSDPFGDLPFELRRLFESGMSGMSGLFGASAMPFGFQPTSQSPVDWEMAKRVAEHTLGDTPQTITEADKELARQAFVIAEQWLESTNLPELAGPDTVVIATKTTWIDAAIGTLAPLIEPIATATTAALTKLTREALEGLDETDLDQLAIPGMDALPDGFHDMLKQFMSQDPGQFLAPAARALAGLQAGQVLGELAGRLLYQHEFTLPTASHNDAYVLMGNVTESFAGYGLDMRDVTVAIALEEAAFRRVFQAVPWLNAHIRGLFETFAAGITFDRDLLERLSRDFVGELDVTDEEGLQQAMERAARFQIPPTKEQQAVIDQLHVVLGVVGAWARREALTVATARIPAFTTILEVLRRRRAAAASGEAQLQSLLGLTFTPNDTTPSETFIAVVLDTLGTTGLMRALAHPENLPTADELSDPTRWQARLDTPGIPDDVAGLFASLGDAPVEPSAAERTEQHEADGDVGDQDGDGAKG